MNESLQLLKVSLLNIGYARLDKSWDYQDVISPFSRLYLIKSGTAKVYHHQQVFTLKKDHLYLVPSYTYSRYKCDNRMEQFYIHFLEEIGAGISLYNKCTFLYERKAAAIDKLLFERLLEINPHRSLGKSDPKVYDNKTMLQNFAELNHRSTARDAIETQGVLKILFSGFIKSDQADASSTADISKRLSEVMQYIGEHISEDITVQHLASHCHLNPDYFSRIFKKHTGMRPLEYLHTKRIERAQLLLTTTAHSLQEIADMVGLCNISYFNRIFTRLSQRTPAAYRKANWHI
ncbi:MAG: helix-turn-helix domain-containing protein [Agriterribacter sp.]